MVMNRKFWAVAAVTVGLASGMPQAQEPGQSGGVFKVGNGVSAPRVIARVDPDYSAEAQDAKVEGTVLLSVVIESDGLAHDINVVKKLGSGLDEKAVEAVLKWKFQPGMKDGVAVAVRAQIEVNFRLK
jgi:TonB family protein